MGGLSKQSESVLLLSPFMSPTLILPFWLHPTSTSPRVTATQKFLLGPWSLSHSSSQAHHLIPGLSYLLRHVIAPLCGVAYQCYFLRKCDCAVSSQDGAWATFTSSVQTFHFFPLCSLAPCNQKLQALELQRLDV